MRAFSSLFLFSSTLLALAARGQEAPLSLDAALALAAERNPGLIAQAHVERSAGALAEQAAFRPNPTLEAEAENVAGTGALRGTRRLEATVRASQVFERGGRREKRVALARRDQESAAQEYAARRAEVLAATAAAFVETAAAQQRLALAGEPVRLAREMASAAEAGARGGAGSAIDSARARAALAVAEGEQARAHAALAAARVRLAATWGGTAAEVPAVAGDWRIPARLPESAGFLARLPSHPRLGVQRAVVAARQAALDLERTQAAPDITVNGGVRFLREGSDAGFVAGVSVPLPVRHRNQGNVRAARETLAGAEQEVRAVEAELQADFAAAWQELSAFHAAIQQLHDDALPAAEKAYDLARRAYAAGELPQLDVLEAQRALIALRRELLDSEVAFVGAHVRAEALADSRFPATAALLSSR